MNGAYVNQCKEDLSEAYLRSVAAAAGCWISRLERDYDGIDMFVTRYGDNGTFPDAPLRVQLKATHDVEFSDDDVVYDLSVSNYNKLRVKRSSAPAILMLVVVPPDPVAWIEQDEEDLHLFRAGYWCNLLGAPPTTNQSTIRIEVPRAQLVTVAELQNIMAAVTEDGFP